MMYEFKPRGVCSRKIYIELDGNVIKNVKFEGGCNGNTTGISKLVEGMTVQDVAQKLRGTRCGFKSTSCPDQLAIACLEAYEKENGKQA